MNKRRFIDADNKFDLDLTYICDRLIVMAIPCVDSALYRNDIREVARFFATRHYGRMMSFLNRIRSKWKHEYFSTLSAKP